MKNNYRWFTQKRRKLEEGSVTCYDHHQICYYVIVKGSLNIFNKGCFIHAWT